MKKFDIRICKTETVQLNRPEIFLNFRREDSAFSRPIYDLIIEENMDCVYAIRKITMTLFWITVK